MNRREGDQYLERAVRTTATSLSILLVVVPDGTEAVGRTIKLCVGGVRLARDYAYNIRGQCFVIMFFGLNTGLLLTLSRILQHKNSSYPTLGSSGCIHWKPSCGIDYPSEDGSLQHIERVWYA